MIYLVYFYIFLKFNSKLPHVLADTNLVNDNLIFEVTTTTTVITTKIEEIPFKPQNKIPLNTSSRDTADFECNLNSTVMTNLLKDVQRKPQCYIFKDDINSQNFVNDLREAGVDISQAYNSNFLGGKFCTENQELVDKLRQTYKLEEDIMFKIASTQYPISKHLFLMKNYTNRIFNSYFYNNLIFSILQIDKLFKCFLGYYKYYYTGRNTKIYVLDTSVNIKTPNISNITGTKRSCNSHGDINVDLIVSRTRGYARDAQIIVLDGVDCEGNIHLSEILELLENVKKDIHPTVLLFGVTGPYSEILNGVVENLASSGIIVISPAGNQHDNACYYSPSSSRKILTVGSVDRHTKISKFSNYGSCVRLYSLGQEIYESNNTKGTSHAAATIAGAVAMYLEKYSNANLQEIWSFLDKNSYWNGTYSTFKVPYLSLEYNHKDFDFVEDDTNGFYICIILLIIIFLLFIVLCYYIHKYRKRKKRRDYVIDTNLRNFSEN